MSLSQAIISTFLHIISPFSYKNTNKNFFSLTMKNAKWLENDQILVGGQISINDINIMHAMDITLIVNMRMADEYDDRPLQHHSQHLGITFIQMPITKDAGVSLENMQKMDALLQVHKKEKIALYCASSNRIGALFALRAYYQHHKSVKEALHIGSQAGLKNLKSYVKRYFKKFPR